jgi:hypothetical protein
LYVSVISLISLTFLSLVIDRVFWCYIRLYAKKIKEWLMPYKWLFYIIFFVPFSTAFYGFLNKGRRYMEAIQAFGFSVDSSGRIKILIIFSRTPAGGIFTAESQRTQRLNCRHVLSATLRFKFCCRLRRSKKFTALAPDDWFWRRLPEVSVGL